MVHHNYMEDWTVMRALIEEGGRKQERRKRQWRVDLDAVGGPIVGSIFNLLLTATSTALA